jgi:hypothetical protein
MNDIGVGIFCFGEDYYYKGAIEKINRFIGDDIHCYILTENPDYFKSKYASNIVHTILYDKSYKSYHDKMILPKIILKNHDYCLMIDADTHITDYAFIDILKDYKIKYGITYIDTLLNHSAKKEFVKDLVSDNQEWNAYRNYAQTIYPNYGEFETMWEYFLLINKIGFNKKRFYEYYEKLALSKNFSDLPMNKDVNGAGEGVSISISAKLSDTDIQRDVDLYNIIKDNMLSISRRYTPRELWPNWMK